MNTRTKLVSTNQAVDGAGVPQTAGAAYSLAIAAAGVGVQLISFSGFCNGTLNSQYFIMFFAGQSIPANGAQSLYKMQVLGGDGFKSDYLPHGISSTGFMSTATGVAVPNTGGLIAVLSTTAETLTIATGAVTMDLDVFIEEYESLQANTTTVGNLTSARLSLQVWSEAAGIGANNLNGQLQLLKVWALNSNNPAAPSYLQLFAQDSPATNAAAQTTLVNIPQATSPVVGGTYAPSITVKSALIPLMQWTLPNSYLQNAANPLVIGSVYKIISFSGGDDFSNVGAYNITGNIFTATGTTPNTWTNNSTLTQIYNPLNFGEGDSGTDPFSIDVGTTTWRRGCSLFWSITSGYLTAPALSTGLNIQAQYK